MYQCYVVQKFGNEPFNVILGEEFKTEDEAKEIVATYIKYFGKVSRVVIEPSGTPIPTEPKKKRSWKEVIKDTVNDLLDWIAGIE